MPLPIGTRIGPYEITAPLGAGGMGEVYRARDPRLGRDVAIKALPAEFAADAERLARFEREARLLASLSHPNIAGIHGVEEANGTRYLVLEFVDGETLAARLSRGALPVDEAVDIGRQIAAAVEAAHESGVIHRDLKPGNVMLTPAGGVKVLDFGLARSGASAGDTSLSASPTMTYAATSAGMILGTAAYMSPEQARGKPVDRRTDIWSFGCVLYECLTGRAVFAGETVSDLIAKILQTEPDWAALPAASPPRLRALIERCLRRDAKERQRDLGDVRLELDEIAKGGDAWAIGATPADGSSGGPPRKSASPSAMLQIAAAIAAAVIGVVATKLVSREPPPPASVLSVVLPRAERLEGGLEYHLMAISPDGRALVYCSQGEGQARLMLRRFDAPAPVELAGTEDARNPFFSPDGEWIGFFAGRKMRKVSVRGGTPVDLADVGGDRGGTWLEDGTIVFSPVFASALYRISEDGGEPRPVTVVDTTRGERTHRWPCALPGGEWVVFTTGVQNSPGNYDDANVEAVSLKTGERRVLGRGGCARYAPGGRLIVARAGSLYALPIDPKNPRGGGTAVPVFDGVLGEPTAGAAHFDIARDGTLILVAGRQERERSRLAWIDMSGRRTDLTAPADSYLRLCVSEDGVRVLAEVGPGGGDSEVVLLDLARGTSTPLTTGHGGRDGGPLWLPGGRRFVWSRGAGPGEEIVSRSIAGADTPLVAHRAAQPVMLRSVTPDGSAVVFSEYGLVNSDVSLVALDGKSAPRVLVADPGSQAQGMLSPDGRWLAYVTDETGQREVCVVPVDRQGLRVQVSRAGGVGPMWAPNGRELYYLSGASLMATRLDYDENGVVPDSTRALFALPVTSSDGSLRDIDIHPSGEKFLVRVPPTEANERREITVMLNWSGTLDARAKARN
jgi:serine/threonine-protein kinase